MEKSKEDNSVEAHIYRMAKMSEESAWQYYDEAVCAYKTVEISNPDVVDLCDRVAERVRKIILKKY